MCREGTFRRIASPVALAEEMTAVHRQVLLKGGPVLQFDQPVHADGRTSPVPVVANLFGTPERVAAGLGVALADIPALGQFLAALRSPVPPDGMRDALALAATGCCPAQPAEADQPGAGAGRGDERA
ncbi:hypothetical protein V6L77_06800 [Pannonibacter sp. Pt2-lr]